MPQLTDTACNPSRRRGRCRPAGRQTHALRRQGRAGPLVHLFALLALCASSGTPAAPAAIQSQDALREAARTFLQTQLVLEADNSAEITLGRLDPRLRLAPCQGPLRPFLPAGARLQGKLNVGVQCPDGKPWTVYLPASIHLYGEVLTTSRPIGRGEILRADDVRPRRQELGRLAGGYFRRDDAVVGKRAVRALPAGTPLDPRMLKAPRVIQRGDAVSILVSLGGLQVRSRGKALADAARGERLSVRNLSSKRIVEGIAVDPGTVRIAM